MTIEEFNTWIRCHIAHYPGLRPWFRKMPEGGASTREKWFSLLEDFTTEECDRATAAMFKGGDNPFFSEIPHEVKALVMKARKDNPRRRLHRQPPPKASAPPPAVDPNWKPPELHRNDTGEWCFPDDSVVDVRQYGPAFRGGPPLINVSDTGEWQFFMVSSYHHWKRFKNMFRSCLEDPPPTRREWNPDEHADQYTK